MVAVNCLTSHNQMFYQLSLLFLLPCNFVVMKHRVSAVQHWAKTEYCCDVICYNSEQTVL